MDERRLLKAIARKCRECCNGQRREVLLCPSKDCPLWLYRTGDELTGSEPTGNERPGSKQTESEHTDDERVEPVPAEASPAQGALFD
jgi:hypothetical protein